MPEAGVLSGKDKKKHFAASAAIAAVVAVGADAGTNMSPGLALLAGIVASVVAGLGKELYDWKNPSKGTADAKDIVADLIGTVAGAVGAALWIFVGRGGS